MRARQALSSTAGNMCPFIQPKLQTMANILPFLNMRTHTHSAKEERVTEMMNGECDVSSRTDNVFK